MQFRRQSYYFFVVYNLSYLPRKEETHAQDAGAIKLINVVVRDRLSLLNADTFWTEAKQDQR